MGRGQKRTLSNSLLWILTLVFGIPWAGAQVVIQVSDSRTTIASPGALDDAGNVVITGSSADLFGSNPEHGFELVSFDPVTGAATQITSRAGSFAVAASVSDDGQWLALVSSEDLTGDNHDRSPELFVMQINGTGLAQLTDEPALDGGGVSSTVISGDGQSVLFAARIDPLGSNPDRVEQLFLIQRDGSDLLQLTAFALGTPGGFGLVSISDDGTRIVFSHSGDPLGGDPDLGGELYAIAGDGSGLRQLTTTAAPYGASLPQIAGDGAIIAFQSQADPVGNNAENYDEIFSIQWDGSNLAQATNTQTVLGITGDPASQFPSITDDGAWIYYHSNHSSLFSNFDGNYEICRVHADGSSRQTLTSTLLSAGSFLPVVSGNGSRVAYYGLDSDLTLRAINGTGGGERSLIAADLVFNQAPEVSPDGSRIVFVRSTSLLGGGQIWRVEADERIPVQVSNFSSGTPADLSLAGDRETIVFSLESEIWTLRADGSGLLQLTDGPGGTTRARPAVASDASVVVFDSDDGTQREIYRVGLDSTGLQRLTFAAAGNSSQRPRVDGIGAWITFESNADLAGSNADGSFEIFRMRSDGSSLTQVTDAVGQDSRAPDISSDGMRVVFSSTADHLGTNPEGNRELFLHDASVGVLSQLTDSVTGNSSQPGISGDGTWVYFSSDAPFFEDDLDRPTDLYRVPASGGAIQRVSARRAGASLGLGPIQLGGAGVLAVAESGNVAVFSGIGDFTSENPDLMPEIWRIDRGTAAILEVGQASPTVLTWTYESGPIRYDVVRGRVGELAAGVASGVDLGAVVCLESDSPDADTLGFGDAAEPEVGDAFFFLTRGSQGLLVGPGSYGQGSSGGERIPAAGDCP